MARIAKAHSRCRLISSSDTLLQLINGLERDPGFMQFWEEQVHSAFVYAGDDSEILRKLIRRLTGDNGIVISKINPGVGDLTVSDQLDDFCKVMAGVRTAASKADWDTVSFSTHPKRIQSASFRSVMARLS